MSAKAKFDIKTLRYPHAMEDRYICIIENAHCYGGICVAKKAEYWRIYSERTGLCISDWHNFDSLEAAKAAVMDLLDMPDVNWHSVDPFTHDGQYKLGRQRAFSMFRILDKHTAPEI